eukprot:561108-Amorphochlora_amoeboformis.AAC.1
MDRGSAQASHQLSAILHRRRHSVEYNTPFQVPFKLHSKISKYAHLALVNYGRKARRNESMELSDKTREQS